MSFLNCSQIIELYLEKIQKFNQIHCLFVFLRANIHVFLVIVTQPPATVFKWNPVAMTCPYCHHIIVTKVRSESGLLAWLLCGVMFLTG